jgi:hypothetical protein
MSRQQIQGRVAQESARQRRIPIGIGAAFAGDVIAFTTLLFFFPDAFQRAGSILIMLAMGYLTRRLQLRRAKATTAQSEIAARPSIDAYRAALDAQLEFYRALLAFAAVVPGVGLFIFGAIRSEPEAWPFGLATVVLLLAGMANGCRMHLPHARRLLEQLRELDAL